MILDIIFIGGWHRYTPIAEGVKWQDMMSPAMVRKSYNFLKLKSDFGISKFLHHLAMAEEQWNADIWVSG
jgi:hypothetical protein